MLLNHNLALVATSASLASALTKGAIVGSSGGTAKGAALGGPAGYGIGSLGSRPDYADPYKSDRPESSLTDSPVLTSDGQTSRYPKLGQGSSGLASPNTAAALYTISNVTIHQYPSISIGHNGSSNSSPIMEDFNLTVSSVSNMGGDSNPPLAAECNLTWIASTANSSGPPATGQMTCINRTGASAPYNVTLQQQTQSPIIGFFAYVSAGNSTPGIWMARNISNDPHWIINENYATNAGPINTSPHMPNQTLAQYLGLQSPNTNNDPIKVADLSNSTIANAAAGGSTTSSDDHIKVADLSNSAIANEAASAPIATLTSQGDMTGEKFTQQPSQRGNRRRAQNQPTPPSDQIKVEDLTDHDIASEVANAPASGLYSHSR